MSKIGMKHLTQNPYGGLAFGKGGLTSSTSPLWSPQGAYNFGGFYGEADGSAARSCCTSCSCPAPAPKKSSELMDFIKSPLGMVLVAVGGYMIYKNMSSPKKASNPRRKRNGTKKGMARKTARKAYMKKRPTRRNRKQSAYNKFVGKQMKAGKSMKQAAAAWRRR